MTPAPAPTAGKSNVGAPMAVDVARLEELARGASPGPWLVSKARMCIDTAQIGSDGNAYDAYSIAPCISADDPEAVEAWERDAALIAACSPSTILALCERVRVAEARADRLAGPLKRANELPRVGQIWRRSWGDRTLRRRVTSVTQDPNLGVWLVATKVIGGSESHGLYSAARFMKAHRREQAIMDERGPIDCDGRDAEGET